MKGAAQVIRVVFGLWSYRDYDVTTSAGRDKFNHDVFVAVSKGYKLRIERIS